MHPVYTDALIAANAKDNIRSCSTEARHSNFLSLIECCGAQSTQ